MPRNPSRTEFLCCLGALLLVFIACYLLLSLNACAPVPPTVARPVFTGDPGANRAELRTDFQEPEPERHIH